MKLSTIDRIHVLRRAEQMQRRLETMLADVKTLVGDLQPPGEALPASETCIHTSKVISAVAKALRLIPSDLYGGRRFPRAITGRKAAAFALRELGLTFQQVATALRFKEHTTARRSVKLGRELMIQREFAAAVEAGMRAGRTFVAPAEDHSERLTFGHRDGCTCGMCSAGRADDGAASLAGEQAVLQ